MNPSESGQQQSGGLPHGPADRMCVTINAEEQQVLLMALGELLDSVERSEHLTPTIRALIERIRLAPPFEG